MQRISGNELLNAIQPARDPGAPSLFESPLLRGSRDAVRVVCHRGDWRNFVENSLEAVEKCVEMQADVVEIDVWRTKDGHLILMHDETLDRTTNGRGPVAHHTLEEIRALRLKDGLGNMTDFEIPTLREVLLLVKDRIIINLDKCDNYYDEVYPLLLQTGTLSQAILKSELPYDALCKKWGDLMTKIIFMPILNITRSTTLEDLHQCFQPSHELYEINFEEEDHDKLQFVKDTARNSGAALWINTLWPSTCASHHDDRALKDKAGSWGYVVDELGASFIQTDRPALLLQYLKERGSR